MANIDVEITPGDPGGAPAAAAFASANLFLMVQSGAFVLGTGTQLLTYVNANLDATLVALAGVTVASNKGLYATGADAFSTYDLTAGGRALGGVAGTADTFPYFSASNVVTLGSITAAGRALLDDADASAQRTTLGLGSLATASNINNSNWSGTDLSVANGGTGSSTESAARTALGLAIGTDVQAYDADLAAIAALSTTSWGRNLLTLANAKALDALSERTAVDVGIWGSLRPLATGTTFSANGLLTPSAYGTAGAASPANTNYRTRRHRVTYTSATTASAQAGNRVASWLYRADGFDFMAQFGVGGLPLNPRLFVGFQSSSGALAAGEPSAVTSCIFFGKDSTDTNIQFCSNDGSGTASKQDTGIALAVDGWYEVRIWCESGGSDVYGRITRHDTGTTWEGTISSDLPTTTTAQHINVMGALNGTDTGTAIILDVGTIFARSGL